MLPLVANTLYALGVVFAVLVPLLAGLFLLFRRLLLEADRKNQQRAEEEEREKNKKDEAQKVLKGMAKRWRQRKIQRALKVQYAAAAEALRKDATRQFTAEEDEYIWKAIDKNGNGMLSRADIKEAFRLIDKNGNGVLSRAEVIKACRASERVHTLLGLPKNIRQEDGTRDLFELVFQELDADGSKSITLDEFTSYLRKSMSSHHLGKDNPIWEQISGKLSRRLPDGVRNRYLELQSTAIKKEERKEIEKEEAKRPFTAEDDKVIWNEVKRIRNAVLSPEFEEAFDLIDENRKGVLSRAEVIKACEANAKVRKLLGLPKKQEDGTRDSFEAVFQKMVDEDNDDSKSIKLDEFTSYLVPDHADQIWEQISDKLGRCLANSVRSRYLYLRKSRDSPARANWTRWKRQIRKVGIRNPLAVAISWRALADGAVEHEQRKAVEEERKKEGHAEGLLGRLLGAPKTPTVKKSRFVGSGRGREEWQFPLSANLDIIYSLRQERGFSHSPRKYTDEWWDKDSHFPAKKHKALCKLKYHYFAKRSPGYGALFSTERGGSDSSRSSRGRLQDLSLGTPIKPWAITYNPTPTSGSPSKRPQVPGGGQPGGGSATTPLFARPDTTPQQASPPINDPDLRSRLAAFQAKGWQAVDVGGGGDCFFRALAKQVLGDEQLHGPARQLTIRYMREHREEFEEFVGDFDSYVDRMSREGTYVEGEVEILAAANAFNVHIKVYGRSGAHDKTFSPLISNYETRPIYIVHYQDAQHYVVLERMDPAPTARGCRPRSMSTSRRDLSLGTPSAPATARRPSTCTLRSAASERQVNAAIDSGAGAITPPQPPRPNSGPTARGGLDRPGSSRGPRQDSRGTPSARILPLASQLPRPNSGPTDLGGLDRSWSRRELQQDKRDSRRTPSATSLYSASAKSSSQSTNPATNSGMDGWDA